MSEIVIKPIEVAQLDEFTWTGSQTHLEYFKEALERSSNGMVLFLGAWVDGQAVGRCGIDFERNEGKATLWMFNVRDEFQSKGIGSQLMDEAERQVIKRNISEIVLNVEKINPRAQQLYIRRGYVVTGEGTESWQEDGPDGTQVTYVADVVHMSKSLG